MELSDIVLKGEAKRVKKELKELKESTKKEISSEARKITFADYINPPQQAIELIKQIKNPTKYIKFGISLPRGVLLTGDPGTGKTYLARAIAGELDCPFFEYGATEFIKKYMGEGPESIRTAFNNAKNAAKTSGKNLAVIFIDEFDSIGSREKLEGETAGNLRPLINEFLKQMDGFAQDPHVSIIVIAATNYPENIDPALKRRGRFDITIHIPYPNEQARKKIIEKEISKTFINQNIKEYLEDKLVTITEGASPVEIVSIFQEAGKKAIQKNIDETGIDYDCFAQALWDMKQSNHKKQLPPRPEKEKVIKRYLYHYGLGTISIDLLLSKMQNMTILDIQEVFELAFKHATEKRDRKEDFTYWLFNAITAKNQQLKIRQNQDIIKICNTLYAPIKLEFTKNELLGKEAHDIFNEFDKEYQSTISEKK